MFDFNLFILLVLVSIPGILITVSRQVDRLGNLAQAGLARTARMPDRRVLVVLATLQNLVLVAGASALGTWLAPGTALQYPLFGSMASGALDWTPITAGLLTTVIVSLAGAFLFVLAYYRLFSPWMDPHTREVTERLRMELGMTARLLYGGVAEEILFRWGVMTALVALGSLLVAPPSAVVIWSAILISGLLFGLAHLPGIAASGGLLSFPVVVASLALNLWASMIFGWLYWRVGLFAAVLGHMILHLVWYPFEKQAASAHRPGRSVS